MRPPPFPIRRVVIVVPSLFTLFNLFFGIWSMVLATRGEFYRASWFIVFIYSMAGSRAFRVREPASARSSIVSSTS